MSLCGRWTSRVTSERGVSGQGVVFVPRGDAVIDDRARVFQRLIVMEAGLSIEKNVVGINGPVHIPAVSSAFGVDVRVWRVDHARKLAVAIDRHALAHRGIVIAVKGDIGGDERGIYDAVVRELERAPGVKGGGDMSGKS